MSLSELKAHRRVRYSCMLSNGNDITLNEIVNYFAKW